MYFRIPLAAELCGPRVAPDDRALLLAVQHPASDGVRHYKPFGKAAAYDDPATRWPDFNPEMPPRPSVVVITPKGGGHHRIVSFRSPEALHWSAFWRFFFDLEK